MNIERYLEKRRLALESRTATRELCVTCLQPKFGCYCAEVRPFDPEMRFVILHHPIEMKRRIATGRMAHLCLRDSHLIVGHDYSEDQRVDRLAADPEFAPVLLYPGRSSVNLSTASVEERKALFPEGKRPCVFVVDGTWNTARQTVHRSRNLRALPRACFTPPGPSNFRVRKQPAPECYSTIEAIHHVIELLGPGAGFDLSSRAHDALLDVFGVMVERQLRFIGQPLRRRTRGAAHA